jgi:hypothetical protein
MGHFEPEKLQSADAINIVPNQHDNTVDITYNVVEKSNSQFEIAGVGVEILLLGPSG